MDENELEDLAYHMLVCDEETYQMLIESLSDFEFEFICKIQESIIYKWSVEKK